MAIRSLRARFAPVTNQPARTSDDLLHQGGDRDTRKTDVVRKSIFSHIDTSRIGKLIAAGVLGAVVCTSSGCSLTSGTYRAIKRCDGVDKFLLSHRNKVMAAKAWHNEAHRYKNCPNLGDIQAGYMQGYMDVALGGDGCAPAVAPATYWGWRYQSAGGQSCVNSWFQGYPLGVRAAERDGVGHWGNIRPSGNVAQSKQAVYMPPATAEAENGENPFYNEPAQLEPVDDAPFDDDFKSDDNAVDNTIDVPVPNPLEDQLGEGFDDVPLNIDEEAIAPEAPSEVGDAIRDALDDASSSSFDSAPPVAFPVGETEFGHADFGNTELGSTELGSTELGSTELGSTELGSTELGSTELGSTELGSTEFGNAESYTEELSADEFGADGEFVADPNYTAPEFESGEDFGSSEETGVRFSVDHDDVMERMFGKDALPPSATRVEGSTEELPYAFD